MNIANLDPSQSQRWRMNQISAKREREIDALQAAPNAELANLERKMSKIFRVGTKNQELILVIIDSELYLPILYSMLASLSGNRPIVADLAVLGEVRRHQVNDVSKGISMSAYDAKYKNAPNIVDILGQDLSRSVLIDGYAPDAEEDEVLGSQYLALNFRRDMEVLGTRRGPGVVLFAIPARSLGDFPGDLYSHRLSTAIVGEGEPMPRTNLAAEMFVY